MLKHQQPNRKISRNKWIENKLYTDKRVQMGNKTSISKYKNF